VYNIGNKFDGGACAYKNCQRLPMTVYLCRWHTVRYRSRKSTPKIGAEIDPDFCTVCHANSDPKSARKLGAENGRRLEHCSIPSR